MEFKLQEMFPSGYPVLCSSGRSALSLALEESVLSRGDYVGVFPYASHCVLDAISRFATPLSGKESAHAPLRVIYHQWGYLNNTIFPENAIEDCVDTLCVPGAMLFPGGGKYEIWSLPKIAGTTSGGVLWCKEAELASRLRLRRDQRGGGLVQWLLRLAGLKWRRAHLYWQGFENESGKITVWQAGEISRALDNWEELVRSRRNNLDRVWSLAPKWLKKPVKRLPPVVPVLTNISGEQAKQLGIEAGFRMFERNGNNMTGDLVKMLPIPIHQDVSQKWITVVLDALSENTGSE